jgi:HD superfamily phosphohydrolase
VSPSLAIHDSLNGRIPLKPLEYDLLASKPLLRLGRILQLGMGNQVFPGATHTRFAHSLGVMHIAGRLGEALDLDPDEEVEKLRLAGLLHDVGQYPLSHCIEQVYRMIGDPAADPATQLFQDTVELDALEERPLLQQVTLLRPSSGEATDKSIGRQVILRRPDLRALFEKAGKNDEWVEDMAAIVAGVHTDTLYQALMNSDYDADRLDYVRRDAQMAGLVYGEIDLEYLLGSLEIRYWPVTSNNRIVAVHKRKGLVALEHYLMARFYMYSQVVFHKTIRSLELIAKAAFLGLAREGIVFPSYKEILEAVETDRFIEFNDVFFFEAMQDYARRGSNAEIKQLAMLLLQRRPLPLVSEIRLLAESEEDGNYREAKLALTQQDMLQGLAERSGVAPEEIIIDWVPAIELVPLAKDVPTYRYMELAERFERGVGTADDLRVIAIAPRLYVPEDDRQSFLLVEDPGSLISYLAKQRLFLIRVYLSREDPDAEMRLHDEIRRVVPRAS